MHDLDRTYLEDSEGAELAAEHEADGAYEADAEVYGDGEDEAYGEDEAHGDGEAEAYGDGEVFQEDEVTEIAAELLGVSSEDELDHFLGDFLKKAGDALGKFVSSGQGKALGGMMKSIAKKVIPALANAYAPGTGGAIANVFGLELEGLSPEDQEFEAAKQYVRLGAEAVKQAVGAPESEDPNAVSATALTRAAQQYAPGLLRGAPGAMSAMQPQSGRWFRRGRHIILQGVY